MRIASRRYMNVQISLNTVSLLYILYDIFLAEIHREGICESPLPVVSPLFPLVSPQDGWTDIKFSGGQALLIETQKRPRDALRDSL